MALDNLYGRENKWRKRVQKRDADTRSKSYHSLAYHRFFENYTEYTTTGKNGKKKIIRKYTGPVYMQDLPGAAGVFLKVFFLLVFAVMVWLIFRTGSMEAQESMGTAWYLALSELLTILFLTYMGYTLLTGYLTAPARMTTGDYKCSSKALMRAAAGSAACFGADLAFTLLSSLLRQGMPASADFVHMGYFAAGVFLSLLMLFLERSIPYRVEEPAERPADDEGMEILYR
ncbi:MAG: hypothetical protein LUG93_08420 [Lachnospiraceae bacterium]|nr:hypothetical protein [Lachnospiraceae bacterium]